MRHAPEGKCQGSRDRPPIHSVANLFENDRFLAKFRTESFRVIACNTLDRWGRKGGGLNASSQARRAKAGKVPFHKTRSVQVRWCWVAWHRWAFTDLEAMLYIWGAMIWKWASSGPRWTYQTVWYFLDWSRGELFLLFQVIRGSTFSIDIQGIWWIQSSAHSLQFHISFSWVRFP